MAPNDRQGAIESTPETAVRIDGEAALDEFVASHEVALVDFYADWCGPCKMIGPVAERWAAEIDAAVATVDVDENQQLATACGVRGVPATVLFVDGEQVEQLVGLRTEDELDEIVAGYLE